jgi:murein DD-endopeptidase MepM/ murein hydrolase activator NlpD
VLAALGAVGIGTVAPAAADSGGAGVRPPAKGKKKSKTKLLPAPAKPTRVAQLADVRCAANPGGPCLDAHRAERGATLQLRGRSLSTARQIVFYGGRGAADDAVAPVSGPQATRAVATVPARALTGPVAVIDSAGKRSSPWDGLIVDIPQSFTFRPASAVPGVQVGLSQPRTIFFGGMQKAIFNFQVTGTRALDVRIDLVRQTDGVIVQSWQRPGAGPGVTQRITWNGAVLGRPQPQGRYTFRVTVPSAVGARAEPPPPDDRDAITLMGYVFPIRGPHQFGTGAGRFGAARRGHRHQGQDTFARCGTPLVAARGGKVVYSGYQSLAGYYVAIHGAGSGVDYMYAHLRQPALVATGENVYTGQQIGDVGDTGDAVGCHLHFEEWTAPGWYKGGHPYDPLPDLKRWDALSPGVVQ